MDLNSLDSVKKAASTWVKKLTGGGGGGGGDAEYGKDFVRDTSSGVAKNVSNAIKKVPVPSIDELLK